MNGSLRRVSLAILLTIGLLLIPLLGPSWTMGAQVAAANPVITAVTPNHGAVGSQVVVTGSSFGAGKGFWGNSTVRFGAVSAPVTSWTDTKIVCAVPNTVPGLVGVSVHDVETDTYSFSVPFTVELAVFSLTSPTHPDQNAWYKARAVTFRWEGPALSGVAASMYPSWNIIDVAVDGNRAYLSAYPGSMMIVDIGNPRKPVELGYYNCPSNVTAIKSVVAAHGDYAYIGWQIGSTGNRIDVLDTVDVSDPAAPQGVSSLTWAGFTGAYFNEFEINSITLSGTIAYLGISGIAPGSSGPELWLFAVDVADPASPEMVGGCQLTTPGSSGETEGSVLKGNLLYLGGDQLRIVDVTDPTSPQLLSTAQDPSADYLHGPAAAGGYAFAASQGKMDVFDLTNPASPRFAASLPLADSSKQGTCVAVTDPDPNLTKHYAFLGYNHDGYGSIRIADVSDPEKPADLGQLPIPEGWTSWGSIASMVVDGEWLYAGCWGRASGSFFIMHLGPKAYSYSFDQNPSGVPDTVAEAGASGLAASATVNATSDGVWYFHVRPQDELGNWGTTVTRKVCIGSKPPSGTMQLNKGAAATNKLTVTANSAVTGATQMSFASWNGTSWVHTAWTSYAATAEVTLYVPDGVKKVYGYYRNAGGTTFTTTDTIVLDTTPPSGTMLLNKGAVATNKLTVTANSAITGASEMRFVSYNGATKVYTAWQPYAATATVTIYAPDGTKRVYAYYRDAAGNMYSTSDTIVLDTVAPSGTMLLNNGAATTSSTTVTVNSAVKGASEMRFITWNGATKVVGAWQPYAAKATVTLYPPSGTKRVVANYRDPAGNLLTTSDTIVLSTR